MYFNSGYLNNSRLDFKDYSKPLVVGSCGTYRLKSKRELFKYPELKYIPASSSSSEILQ